MKTYTLDDLCQFIDHTNLKPSASDYDMQQLCSEAISYHFKMVAINQSQTKLCSNLLKDTDVHVGAAIAFPLGQTTIDAKIFETANAINSGANEIDYVINITALKNKDYAYLKNEMSSIVSICRNNNVISKVIFENCYLTKEEITIMSKIAKEIQPDFIKTSTGFGPSGATIEDVELMKNIVGPYVKVKAAGGIRDSNTFLNMIKAGAERIGTSSGIKIIEELKNQHPEESLFTIEI